MKESQKKVSMFKMDDPYSLFDDWMNEAKVAETNDANAMALATCDARGLPDVRMVLLKGVDERGFVFYSHKKSAKGQELAGNPQAALNFHWKSLRRQVRVRGTTQELTRMEVGRYFASRPRDSQLGAWASKQSYEMQTRSVFEVAIDKAREKFKDVDIPLPPGWTGWRVEPVSIEFWQDRPFRLHDRLVFERQTETKSWTKRRLYP